MIRFSSSARAARVSSRRSPVEAVLLEVGARRSGEDGVSYPDIDLEITPGAKAYSHRDGTPYDSTSQRSR